MFFTQEDYRKIEKWLLANSRKDTDFVGAATPLKGNETVVLVQDGKNVKTSVKDIVDQFFLLGVSDFLNITDKYGESYISLTQAIQLIPFRSRKIGQVITFIDESGNWAIYQFQGKALNQWNNTTLWIDLLAKVSGIPIIDSEDITTKENGAKQVSLYLADKQYNEADYSGLGRIYLRKNIQTIIDPSTGAVINVNLLTQSMLVKENTIYIIQYDYNLNNQTITIPEGCILDMRGGSVTNGTINCVDTIIISTDASKLDVTLTGTYRFDSEKLVTLNTEDINISQSVDRKSHTISAMLADRDTTNGMGYVILRKDKSFEEQVIQENTIYEIRYDFTLTSDVAIPQNCILHFDGGSLSGNYNITHKADYIYYAKNSIDNREFNNLFKFAKKVIFYNDVSITEPINISDKSEISISGNVVFLYIGVETDPSSGKAVLKFENCSNISIDGIKINGGGETGFISRPLPSEENYNQWIAKRNNILPALMFEDCQHYKVENIQVEYCQVAIANLRSSNGYFNNIYIQHTYADGIMSIYATHDIAISNIHGYDIGDDFISANNTYEENVDNTPYNIVASDCKVTDGKGALMCFEGSRNVSIVNSIGLNMQFAPIKLGSSINGGVYLLGENQSVINCVCTTANITTGNITTNGSNDVKSKNIKLVNVTVDSSNNVSNNPIRFLLHNIEGLFIDNLRVTKCNIHTSNISDLIIKNSYIENYDALNLIGCTNVVVKDNIIKNIGAKYTESSQPALYISGGSNIVVSSNRFTSLETYDISSVNVTNIDLDTNKISYTGSTQILVKPYVNDNDDYSVFKDGQKIRVAGTFCTLYNGKITNANFMSANSSLNPKLLNQYNNGYIICDSGNESGNTGLIFNIGGVLRAFDGETYNIRRRGTTSQRVTPIKSGFCYFDTTLGKPIWWNGTRWVDNMGFLAGLTRGTTAQRPSLGESDYGYMYYDNELMKYITWSGTAWVNMDGTALI